MADDLKLAVVTAQVGAYDHLSDFAYESSGVRAFCFTDLPDQEAKGWNYLPLPFHSPTAKRASLFVKTHPFTVIPESARQVLWLDGRISLNDDPLALVDQAVSRDPDGDFWAFAHPDRASPLEEAAEVERLSLSPNVELARTLRRLTSADRVSERLFETGVLLMSNTSRAAEALRCWWALIEDGSARDQLTFLLACEAAHASVYPLDPLSSSEWARSVRSDVRFDIGSHVEGKAGRLKESSFGEEASGARCTIGYRRSQRSKFPLGNEQLPSRAATQSPIDVVIPIHNAPLETHRCISSVLVSINSDDQVLLVDDGSDKETAEICKGFEAAHPGQVRALRHPSGSGFTKAANRGLRSLSLERNVLLLNSDTVVSRSALVELRAALDSEPGVGAVGPLSNRAIVQSLFDHEAPDTVAFLEQFWALETGSRGAVELLNKVLLEIARVLPPAFYAPTLNGFCMLISSLALESVGLLDEENFPLGYGEETDWTFRAADAGFLLKVVTSSFVYHQKNASYAVEDMAAQKKDAAAYLRAQYGVARLGRAALCVRDHPTLIALRRHFHAPMEGSQELERALETLAEPEWDWLKRAQSR